VADFDFALRLIGALTLLHLFVRWGIHHGRQRRPEPVIALPPHVATALTELEHLAAAGWLTLSSNNYAGVQRLREVVPVVVEWARGRR